MSDNIRINGQAAGQFGGRAPRQGNLQRFKQGRKAGDLVRGAFLRLEATSPGTAWVNLEGEELLAHLPEDLAELARRIFAGRGVGARPSGVSEADFPLRSGALCYFILEALEPEPRLRMLDLRAMQTREAALAWRQAPGEGPNQNKGQEQSAAEAALAWGLAREQAQSLWRGLAELPPAQLAARYATARSALDTLLQERCWPALAALPGLTGQIGPTGETGKAGAKTAPNATANPALCHKFYQQFLLNDAEAMARYAELALRRAALVRALRSLSLRDLLFVPWLCPQATAVDLARLGDYFVLQARLPQGGGQLELRGKCAAAGLDDLGGLRGVGGAGEAGGEWSVLTQKILPPGQGDLLAFLLSLRPVSPIGGGFSRRT